ncbi:alkaline phosphatase family protein [Arthrobacter sp. NamB2]|uniref:alkaline phosphatase family protein n=1 Tax=Arthrobacter sp. NamB2 TaxID=2576035 RepID=UPI0010C99A10|nr:nucleotide pyrophosphatase/phosphodiesterase family protein [Arthrobacter sp. NamB2]TKV28184.1 alkaline phosphatase family protein [Arthrobacter sp. NamB2]
MPFLHREPLPAPPAYGASTVAQVMTSSAAALGVDSFTNALTLPESRRIVVVMVDGLGMVLLKKHAAHAPFLRDSLDSARVLSSAFPSTTAASLASLGTGLPPGQHGMVGYDVLDPAQGRVVNMLGGWDAGVDPLAWQPHPTVFERVSEHLPVVTVSQPRFAESPMTQAALRGGIFVGANTIHARIDAAAQHLSQASRMLMYFYVNDLDKAGHRYGIDSSEWVRALEDLDAALKLLARRVPPDTLLLLTADHGMVDIPASQRIDYSERPELLHGLAHTGGEPRMLHLYFEQGLADAEREAVARRWHEVFGSKAWILTRKEAVDQGYFGAVADTVLPRIGDLVVLAREGIALIDGRRVQPAAFGVVGQHGSLTRAERDIPLLTLAPPIGGGRRRGSGKGAERG